MSSSTIDGWHAIVQSRDTGALNALLASDVVFESPVVHTPQHGKTITNLYLTCAMEVLNNGTFEYLNEWSGESSSVLEFQSTCDGILINGVDIITWNKDSKIVHFKVMIRPLKAVNKLHELMGHALGRKKSP